MVRVVLGGGELADFVSSGSDQRIKLCLPKPGQPTPLGRDRAEVYSLPPAQQPKQRTYTVRWFDPERLELAIDFVVHTHVAPGASWAASVQAGDEIVAVGPSPAYEPNSGANPLVLVGDESALPAMAAILEEVPEGSPVQVFAEVADAEERQTIETAARASWTWLERDGVAAGDSMLLLEAVQAADLGEHPQVWIAAEAEVTRLLREHCMDTLGLPRDRVHALAYWRRGRAG